LRSKPTFPSFLRWTSPNRCAKETLPKTAAVEERPPVVTLPAAQEPGHFSPSIRLFRDPTEYIAKKQLRLDAACAQKPTWLALATRHTLIGTAGVISPASRLVRGNPHSGRIRVAIFGPPETAPRLRPTDLRASGPPQGFDGLRRFGD
jgi:hypothetical protein